MPGLRTTSSGPFCLPTPLASATVIKVPDIDKYSGTQLTPAKAANIRQRLLSGQSVRSIAKQLHCSPSTIFALRNRESQSLGSWRSNASSKLGEFICVATERLADEVDNISPAQLPLAIGIAIDKKLILDGDTSAQLPKPEQSMTPAKLLSALQINVQVSVHSPSQTSNQPVIEHTQTGGGGE